MRESRRELYIHPIKQSYLLPALIVCNIFSYKPSPAQISLDY